MIDAIDDIHGPRSKLLKGEPFVTIFKSPTGADNLLTVMYILSRKMLA